MTQNRAIRSEDSIDIPGPGGHESVTHQPLSGGRRLPGAAGYHPGGPPGV
jgi:hypothetical protein